MMIKISLIDILKNILIMVPHIKRMARLTHKTGIMNDTRTSLLRASDLLKIMQEHSIKEGQVVEFGPGKTGDTIIALSESERVSRAFAVDTEKYFSDDYWFNNGVEFLYRNSHSLPEKSVDLVYCYDVLEHVNDPESFLNEIKRITKKNGVIFLSWDLRDHLHIDNEEEWFDMHKYSKAIWNLQMSNRSSYVNRLLFNQWIDMFSKCGLDVYVIVKLLSDTARAGYYERTGNKIDATYRVKALLYPN